MEYSQIYEIKRYIHFRPMSAIVKRINELKRTHQGLEIEMESVDYGKRIDEESIMDMLDSLECFNIGGKIKISVRGDLEKEILEDCANRIGTILTTKEN